MSNQPSIFTPVNQIIAGSGIVGLLKTAALLRLLNRRRTTVDVAFTSPDEVDAIDLTKWKPNRTVALVDVPISHNQEKTVEFIRRIQDAGHTLFLVCDETDDEEWERILISFNGLLCEPHKTICKMSMEFEDELDKHGNRLLFELDADPDDADYSGEDFIRVFIQDAMKTAMDDDERRKYLAWHFARNEKPNAQIKKWIEEK